MIKGYIYKVTNLINGKIYIGQTLYFNKRKADHRAACSKHYLHRAIKKYGKDNFKFDIIEEIHCTDKEHLLQWLSEREKDYIRIYGSYIRGIGYNVTKGGDAFYGYVHTDADKKKMSERMKGSGNNFYGKKHTEEVKRKLSEERKGYKSLLFGRVVSDEEKAKLSRLKKGKSNYKVIGSKRTDEQRIKMSIASKGKKKSVEHCLNISKAKKGKQPTGFNAYNKSIAIPVTINNITYPSVTAASKELGISICTIFYRARNPRSPSYQLGKIISNEIFAY